GRDGGDAQPLVDHRSLRVIDAGDDVVDAEVLASDPGDEDVRVVAARDGGNCRRLLDARLDEPVAIEPDAAAGRPGAARPAATEGVGAAVDDGNGVASGDELVCQR